MSSHIVAVERDVRPASITRSRLGGLDLMIWRGASGAIHVWEDRCPHRSVRLSAGRNMGTYLEGVYHGWRFGEDGTVIHVPAEGGKAHPEISVRKLNSVVSGGFVWASEGEAVAGSLSGSPLRPLHILASAETVRQHLGGQAQFHVTPWGDEACMVFGAGETPVEAHAELSALRRELEAGR